MDQLLQVIKQVPFFQKYIENGWEKVCSQCLEEMTYQCFEPDQEIFAQGTIGESFYVILEGQVGVYVNIVGNLEDNKIVPTNPNITQDAVQDTNEGQEGGEQQIQEPPKLQKLVKVLESGDSFGELSLIYNRPRLASIKTLEKTHLAVLNKKEFRSILREKEEAQLVKEMQYFTTLPFFEGQNFNLVRDIFLNTFKLKVIHNEIIFNEGDASDSVFIIKSGEFVVYKQFCHEENQQHKMNQDIIAPEVNLYHRHANKLDKKYKQMTLTVLGCNELFGEENLLMSENRTFGVKCQTVSGELLMIKKDQFLNKVMSDTNTSKYIKERCQKKLQNLKKRIENIEGQLNAFSSYLVGDQRKIKLRRNMESMVIDNYYFQKSRENSLEQDEQLSQTQFIAQRKEQNTSNPAIKKQLSRVNTKNFLSPESSLTNIPMLPIQNRIGSEAGIPAQQGINTSLKHIENPFLSQQNLIDEHNVVDSCIQIMKQDSAAYPTKHEKILILKQIASDIQQKNNYIKLNHNNFSTHTGAQIQSLPNSVPPSSRSQYNSEQPTHYDPHCDPMRDQIQVKMNVLQQQQKHFKVFKLEDTVYSGQISHEELSEKLKNMRTPNKKYVDYLKEGKEQNTSLVDSQSSHVKNLIQKMQKRKQEDEENDIYRLENNQVYTLNKIHASQNLPNGQTNEVKSYVQKMISQAETLWPSLNTTAFSSKQISRVESAKLDTPLKLEGNHISSTSEKKSILKNSRPQSSHIIFNYGTKKSPFKQPAEAHQKTSSMNTIAFNFDNMEHKQGLINIRPLSGRAHFTKSLTNLNVIQNTSDQDSLENYSDPTSPSCIGSQRTQNVAFNTETTHSRKDYKNQISTLQSSPLKQQRVNSAKSVHSQPHQTLVSQTSILKPSNSTQQAFDNYFSGIEDISKRSSERDNVSVFNPLVPLSTQQKMFSLQQTQRQQQTQHIAANQKLLASDHLAFKPKLQKRLQSAKGYRNPNFSSYSSSQNSSKGNLIQQTEYVPTYDSPIKKEVKVPLFRPFSSKDRTSLSGSTQFFKNSNCSYNMKIKAKKEQSHIQNMGQQYQKLENTQLQNQYQAPTGSIIKKNDTLYINSNISNKQLLK